MNGFGKIGLAAALLLGFWAPGPAQAAEPPAPAMSSHEQAARELCRLVCGTGSVQTGTAIMSRVKETPEVAPLADAFRGWYVAVMNQWDREGAMAKSYMEAFSEPELRELIAFYRSPLGHKAIEKLPGLIEKEEALSAAQAQEHEPELEIILAARRKELREKAEGPKPP